MDVFIVRTGPTRLRDVLLTAAGEGGFTSSTNHGATSAADNRQRDMATAFDSNRDGQLDLLVTSGEHAGPPSTWGTLNLFHNQVRYTWDSRYRVVRVGRSPNGRATAMGALLTLRINDGGALYIRRMGSSGGTSMQSALDIVHFGVG